MRDERIEKLAELMVNYSVKMKPGDKVVIRGSADAEPLLKALYVKSLQAGAFPLLMPSIPGADLLFYQHASDEQLSYIHPVMKEVISTYDVMFNVICDRNTKALSNVDPAKMVKYSQAGSEIMKIYMERAAKGDLRWSLTLFPTEANAQEAEMSLEEYEDFVFNACMPDRNDPIGYWTQVAARQDKIVEWLKGKKRVHVKGKETDLRLSIEGRTFINCCCKENVPDGEVFTGPVEDSMEGHVYFSYPAIYGGREVTGVRLWFEKGKVVRATAEKNEAFLLQTLDTDAGSRYVGEFAIGTNDGIQKFTGEILFDEKIGGSFHMALGAGYPETGSVNESSVHWDMICDLRDGGEIWVDDELLYQNGRFVIDF